MKLTGTDIKICTTFFIIKDPHQKYLLTLYKFRVSTIIVVIRQQVSKMNLNEFQVCLQRLSRLSRNIL